MSPAKQVPEVSSADSTNECCQRLFDPFFTTKDHDIRMGLAISHSMIGVNGGRIWVDPQEGSGATFHLTFPFSP